MATYTPWTWSSSHARHYSYLIDADGVILDTIWSGPGPGERLHAQEQSTSHTLSTSHHEPKTRSGYWYGHDEEVEEEEEEEEGGENGEVGQAEPNVHSRIDSVPASPYREFDSAPSSTISPPYASQSTSQRSQTAQNYPRIPQTQYTGYLHPSSTSKDAAPVSQSEVNSYTTSQQPRTPVANLPGDVQVAIGFKERRYIQDDKPGEAERLDPRYRRVAKHHHSYFFVPGRVFKMLWTEPAGQANPGKTRNSTHFSTAWLGEQVYSEIRRFVVVRNKGDFSQCLPIQTYRGRGVTRPGLNMADHGVIHTSPRAPLLIRGEFLTKYSIRVEPTADEILEEASRVNYGKAYAVEHNVKVLDIGMVVDGHRYLLKAYFDSAMRG